MRRSSYTVGSLAGPTPDRTALVQQHLIEMIALLGGISMSEGFTRK
jgi:hypothetical protein